MASPGLGQRVGDGEAEIGAHRQHPAVIGGALLGKLDHVLLGQARAVLDDDRGYLDGFESQEADDVVRRPVAGREPGGDLCLGLVIALAGEGDQEFTGNRFRGRCQRLGEAQVHHAHRHIVALGRILDLCQDFEGFSGIGRHGGKASCL